MSKITGVSGSDLIVKCPVAGYPIDKIQWERGELKLLEPILRSLSLIIFIDGQVLPVNRRQRAYNNGTLILEQLQRNEDAGTYVSLAGRRDSQ